jgi:phenylacetate-CoA ligase
MLDPASRSSVDTSASDIATRIKHDIGVTVAVEILPPGTLERSTGKLQRVVDRR